MATPAPAPAPGDGADKFHAEYSSLMDQKIEVEGKSFTLRQIAQCTNHGQGVGGRLTRSLNQAVAFVKSGGVLITEGKAEKILQGLQGANFRNINTKMKDLQDQLPVVSTSKPLSGERASAEVPNKTLEARLGKLEALATVLGKAGASSAKGSIAAGAPVQEKADPVKFGNAKLAVAAARYLTGLNPLDVLGRPEHQGLCDGFNEYMLRKGEDYTEDNVENHFKEFIKEFVGKIADGIATSPTDKAVLDSIATTKNARSLKTSELAATIIARRNDDIKPINDLKKLFVAFLVKEKVVLTPANLNEMYQKFSASAALKVPKNFSIDTHLKPFIDVFNSKSKALETAYKLSTGFDRGNRGVIQSEDGQAVLFHDSTTPSLEYDMKKENGFRNNDAAFIGQTADMNYGGVIDGSGGGKDAYYAATTLAHGAAMLLAQDPRKYGLGLADEKSAVDFFTRCADSGTPEIDGGGSATAVVGAFCRTEAGLQIRGAAVGDAVAIKISRSKQTAEQLNTVTKVDPDDKSIAGGQIAIVSNKEGSGESVENCTTFNVPAAEDDLLLLISDGGPDNFDTALLPLIIFNSTFDKTPAELRAANSGEDGVPFWEKGDPQRLPNAADLGRITSEGKADPNASNEVIAKRLNCYLKLVTESSTKLTDDFYKKRLDGSVPRESAAGKEAKKLYDEQHDKFVSKIDDCAFTVLQAPKARTASTTTTTATAPTPTSAAPGKTRVKLSAELEAQVAAAKPEDVELYKESLLYDSGISEEIDAYTQLLGKLSASRQTVTDSSTGEVKAVLNKKLAGEVKIAYKALVDKLKDDSSDDPALIAAKREIKQDIMDIMTKGIKQDIKDEKDKK